MNANQGDNELTSTLAREAERFHNAHHGDVSMERVMARAGEIRRGRRMRATMVMAAVVLAAAVPVGISALDDPKDKPTPAAPVQVDESPLTLGDLKVGGNPRTGWLEGGTFRDEGVEVPIGKGDQPSYLARLDKGFLLGRYDQQTQTIEAAYYADDNSGGMSWPMDGGFTVSDDGRFGAFVQPDGTVMAVEDDGGYWQLGRITAPGGFVPVGITGNCADSCTVYVDARGTEPATWQVSSDGKVAKVDTGLASANDFHDGEFAGITSVSDEDMSTCSAVTSGGAAQWTTCPDGAPFGVRLAQFSPDGQHVIGIGSVGSGEGESQLAILDAGTGEMLVDLRTGNEAVIRHYTWEDDEHVLALVREGERFAILRIGLNGEREYALAPEKGIDFDTAPFMLPVG